MVQLRTKETKILSYVDSDLQIDFRGHGGRIIDVTYQYDKENHTTTENSPQDPSDIDLDFLKFKHLPKEEFHQKMERLEKRQLNRLRTTLAVHSSVQKDEMTPFDFTKPTTIVYKETKKMNRDQLVRDKRFKSRFITRVPRLKLRLGPLGFAHEIPHLSPKEFDISSILK